MEVILQIVSEVTRNNSYEDEPSWKLLTLYIYHLKAKLLNVLKNENKNAEKESKSSLQSF